jgi:hypothetical protein
MKSTLQKKGIITVFSLGQATMGRLQKIPEGPEYAIYDGHRNYFNSTYIYPIDGGETLQRFIKQGLTHDMMIPYGYDFYAIMEAFDIPYDWAKIGDEVDRCGNTFIHHFVMGLDNKLGNKDGSINRQQVEWMCNTLLRLIQDPVEVVQMIQHRNRFGYTPMELTDNKTILAALGVLIHSGISKL